MAHTRPLLWTAGAILLALNIFVFVVLFSTRSGVLTVTFLNVGQGDAILIESPTGSEVLIDGGKDRSVLRELPKRMGFLDRSLDMVVATHPDADHIGGLAEVFARYKVARLLEPGIPSETPQSQALAAASKGEQGLQSTIARRGMRLHLGGGAYADVLYPDRDVSRVDTNNGSIVLRVVYGETEFLLTGDAPDDVEGFLVTLDGASLQSDVLKAGHHGSRTSTGQLFVDTVTPGAVVVSAGKDNSYGHPHPEVVDRILASGATLYSTVEQGTVSFVSNGRSVEVK